MHGNSILRRIGIWNHKSYDQQTECWNWLGGTAGGEYGVVVYQGKRIFIHRLAAHLWLRFDLKSKLQICHKCDNPKCFNPKHLYIGTQLQNMRDRIVRGRNPKLNHTHCPHGHPYSGENLYIRPSGARECRTCHRIQLHEAWKRNPVDRHKNRRKNNA